MRLPKKMILGLLTILFALNMTACSNPTTSKKPTASEHIKLTTNDEDVYVGFILDTLKNERWYKDKGLFEEQVKKSGGQVKTLAANGIAEVQKKQAELLIEEGVDVLVVVPTDAEAAAEIVDLAHKADVKVISYDRLIKNADLDYYISFDNEKVGEMQATEILKKVKKGNIAYIGGAEADNNAHLLRQGTMKVLQPLIDKGDIKIVYDQFTDQWDGAIAEQNMKLVLKKNNKIDAVIAANDRMAGGAIQALTAVNKAGKVPVSGQDALLEAVQRIYKGTQTMTVYKPIDSLAAQAAEMAIKVGEGEVIETKATVSNGKKDVPSILLDPIAVTKENMDETIIKSGYLKKSDITGAK